MKWTPCQHRKFSPRFRAVVEALLLVFRRLAPAGGECGKAEAPRPLFLPPELCLAIVEQLDPADWMPLFERALRRWRELGGIVAVDAHRDCDRGSTMIAIEEGDADSNYPSELPIDLNTRTEKRRFELIKFVLGGGGTLCKGLTHADLKRRYEGCDERVLQGECGPRANGIESWGDWSIWIERIDKARCPDFVELAMQQLAGWDFDESGAVEVDGEVHWVMPYAWFAAGSMLQELPSASWPAALDRIGRNIVPSMFGAEGTVPEAVACFYDDGNLKIYFVDIGSCMYVCGLSTS